MNAVNDAPRKDRVVVAYTAETPAEAMVIRTLLESAGIHSPSPELVNPLELPAGKIGRRLVEICVVESRAQEARQIIEDYVKSAGSASQGE
jgi:hypothetical protein